VGTTSCGGFRVLRGVVFEFVHKKIFSVSWPWLRCRIF
jgi:hypothetical protein